MAKRVGVLLSGCGRLDGSDISESILTLLVIERAGALAVCAAPDAEQPAVVEHLSGERSAGGRNAWAEAARIAGPQIRPLSALKMDAIDALIVPGGEGPIATLSDYPEKRALNRMPEREKTTGTAASRAALEAFMKEVKAELWIEHDISAYAKQRKSPEYYE